jgi:hypothetical protein
MIFQTLNEQGNIMAISKFMTRSISATAIAMVGTGAMAAGSGTGIESGFTEIGNDLDMLLGGAGGFLIIVISVALAAVMLAIGRGWGQAVIAFAVALFMGYGVTALKGISGVTATADLIAVELVLEVVPQV